VEEERIENRYVRSLAILLEQDKKALAELRAHWERLEKALAPKNEISALLADCEKQLELLSDYIQTYKTLTGVLKTQVKNEKALLQIGREQSDMLGTPIAKIETIERRPKIPPQPDLSGAIEARKQEIAEKKAKIEKLKRGDIEEIDAEITLGGETQTTRSKSKQRPSK